MKKIYDPVLIVLLMTTWLGCKKEQDEQANDLIGYWELAEGAGSITPPTMYPAGNGNLLVFTDTRYGYYGNGQLVKKGTYTTIDDNTVDQNVCLEIPDDQYTRRIVFDTAYAATRKFYQVTDDRLSFISGCYTLDGGQKITYRRIKPNQTFPLE